MGSVQQAVLEFDDEVQAPWRPRLVQGGVAAEAPPSPIELPASRPATPRPVSRRSPSRVGVCRPPATARPSVSPPARPGRPALAGGYSAGRRPAPSARGVRGPGARTRPGRLRLTGRARRLLFVLWLCGGVALGSWLGPLLSGQGSEGLRLAGVTSVVVEPGDTLWSIASTIARDGDVRVVVDEIQRLNGLEGSALVPGQVLHLP